MVNNFIRTALRYLVKHKAYAMLNNFGLSVGLGCFMLISLWVKQELSFDRFHENAERVYRVSANFTDESGKFDQALTPIPLAPALVSDLPEVEDVLRVDQNGAIVKSGEKQFHEGSFFLFVSQ